MSKIGNCLSKIFNPGEMAWENFKQCSRARQVLTVAISILVAIPTLGFGFAPIFRSLVGRVKTEVPPVADKVNQAKTNMDSNPLNQTNPTTPDKATIEKPDPVPNQPQLKPESPIPQPAKQVEQKTEKPLIAGNTHPDLSQLPTDQWHTLIPLHPLGNSSVNSRQEPKPVENDLPILPLGNLNIPNLQYSYGTNQANLPAPPSNPVSPVETSSKVGLNPTKNDYAQMNFACFNDDKVDLLKPVKDFLPGVEIQTYSSEEGVSYKQNWQILFEFIVTRFDEDKTQKAFQRLKADNPKAKVIYVRMHYGNGTYTDSSDYWKEGMKPDAEVRCLVKKDFINNKLYIANPEGLANALKTMVKVLESKEKSEETHFTYGYPLKLVD